MSLVRPASVQHTNNVWAVDRITARPQRRRLRADCPSSLPTCPQRRPTLRRAMAARSFFHLHLVSDSTGETLIAVGRAVAAQYPAVTALEHVYPMVRSKK